jgi:hypothetical protein
MGLWFAQSADLDFEVLSDSVTNTTKIINQKSLQVNEMSLVLLFARQKSLSVTFDELRLLEDGQHVPRPRALSTVLKTIEDWVAEAFMCSVCTL